MIRATSLFSSAMLVLSLSACTEDAEVTDPVVDPMEEGPGSLIDVAEDAGDFTTLLAAVDAAGLTGTLSDEGPFTVLAPTDNAFSALPDGTVEALLADVPALTDILLYHVVNGEVPASAVVDASLVTTLNGVDFKVSVDGDVYINDAMVTVTDIEADNGIIHVIDTVLLPPPTITDIAVADDQFSTLVAALTAADLADTLAGEGPYTVFAPTNAAFDALPDGTVSGLLNDIPALTNILLYHVVASKEAAADVVSSNELTTAQGSGAMVSSDSAGVYIAGAKISITDIPARNGVIHVIDSVMIPE
ncbi:MAG: fasciclin domain-containing protein [Proteobacteria bacterium]|nr:fasciclin domain-containing protein [Pseudomonadota bacterium]